MFLLYAIKSAIVDKEKDNYKDNDKDLQIFGALMDGLKTYSPKEVLEHNQTSKRIWCSFKSGVYDITEYISQHPGGDQILMASGIALDPFYKLFSIHITKEVLSLLRTYRIGNLALEETEGKPQDSDDKHYANEPLRHPALKTVIQKPFYAEPPVEALTSQFLTPNDLFYVANHFPVPQVDVNTYALKIEGFGLKEAKTLTLQEMKTKFTKHTIIVTIQCAGNRRSEMNKIKAVTGPKWGPAAISNAEWSGARLVDVLKYCGLDFNDKNIKHLQFEGLDCDTSSNHYGISIDANTAINSNSDFLIAYEMNGEVLPRDHGFPLRLVAPGIVGARNVKWLSRIILSNEESRSQWQKKDFRSFSPNVDRNNVDFESAPPIQELPVQSAICDPIEGQKINLNENQFIKLRGYAWSGGGRKIIRVDVSADKGKNWITANLQQNDTNINRTYCWSLWEAKIAILDEWKSGQTIELICKATDSSYNSQPGNVEHIWNLIGLVNNAWHRINVTFK